MTRVIDFIKFNPLEVYLKITELQEEAIKSTRKIIYQSLKYAFALNIERINISWIDQVEDVCDFLLKKITAPKFVKYINY